MTADNDWWASGPGRSTCKKCGEEPPLVQEVADSRGIQNFCSVCSHSWWVLKRAPASRKLSAEEYKALPR